MNKLLVHPNKRYLMQENGEPFFYLADTAWSLFQKLSADEVDYYMSVRADQGFNVIQAVALAETDGLATPNVYGRTPLKKINGVYDPTTPDTDGNSYWNHVDYTIKTAEKYGLYIAFLPTWGDKFHKGGGIGPEIFTPENAYIYGKWIAERYCNFTNIIWMLGGDRPLEERHVEIIDAMAKGIKESDNNHLITFHPCGFASSVDYLKNKDYLDFHTNQSSHDTGCYQSWKLLRRVAEEEEKPFMDSEPRYEDHPACFTADYKYLWNADDGRQNTYWNIMEGACGHTYGNHAVWPFNRNPTPYFPYRWEEVMRHDGANQVHLVKELRLSRPYFEFRSAPELVADDSAIMAHQCAGRGEKYAFIYSPLGQPIRAYLQHFKCRAIKATWFDPRTGEKNEFAIVPAAEALFVPPTAGKGCDWILILDVMG